MHLRDVSTRLVPNSHGIISFADHHSLNPVVSYRYKIMGGEGVDFIRPLDFQLLIEDPDLVGTPNLFTPNSFPLNSFADPHPLNPIASILCKNIGGQGGPAFQFLSPVPSLLTLIQLFSIHLLTKYKFRNLFLLIFMQIGRGEGRWGALCF